MFNILIIEDDLVLGPSLHDYLKKKFHVTWLEDGNELNNEQIAKSHLVILDLMLPGLPGETILGIIKKSFPHIPVLVLTAKYSLQSKEYCFTQGADDYLTKPFELRELELRINALLRRYGMESVHIIGDVEIDLEKKTIFKKGREVSLTGRTWSLLEYLLKNKGKIVSKDEIFKNVWTDSFVSGDSLRSYIKELRKILPKDTIKTYKGRGYKLGA